MLGSWALVRPQPGLPLIVEHFCKDLRAWESDGRGENSYVCKGYKEPSFVPLGVTGSIGTRGKGSWGKKEGGAEY